METVLHTKSPKTFSRTVTCADKPCRRIVFFPLYTAVAWVPQACDRKQFVRRKYFSFFTSGLFWYSVNDQTALALLVTRYRRTILSHLPCHNRRPVAVLSFFSPIYWRADSSVCNQWDSRLVFVRSFFGVLRSDISLLGAVCWGHLGVYFTV